VEARGSLSRYLGKFPNKSIGGGDWKITSAEIWRKGTPRTQSRKWEEDRSILAKKGNSVFLRTFQNSGRRAPISTIASWEKYLKENEHFYARTEHLNQKIRYFTTEEGGVHVELPFNSKWNSQATVNNIRRERKHLLGFKYFAGKKILTRTGSETHKVPTTIAQREFGILQQMGKERVSSKNWNFMSVLILLGEDNCIEWPLRKRTGRKWSTSWHTGFKIEMFDKELYSRKKIVQLFVFMESLSKRESHCNERKRKSVVIKLRLRKTPKRKKKQKSHQNKFFFLSQSGKVVRFYLSSKLPRPGERGKIFLLVRTSRYNDGVG